MKTQFRLNVTSLRGCGQEYTQHGDKVGSIMTIPWRSSRRGGNLCCRSGSGRRKGRAPHHSRGSCGPGTAWPADTGSDSRLCSHSHQPVVGLVRKHISTTQ